MEIILLILLVVIALLLYELLKEVRVIRVLVELPKYIRDGFDEQLEKAVKAANEKAGIFPQLYKDVFMNRRNYFKNLKLETREGVKERYKPLTEILDEAETKHTQDN